MSDDREFLSRLYITNSKLPLRYIPNTVLKPNNGDTENFKELKKIEDGIVGFVRKGNNLLLSSNGVGNGKTTWASKIMKAYIFKYANKYTFDYNCPVLFINVPEFLIQKKLAINDPEILAEVSNVEKCIYTAKIVVFDDIATNTASEYDNDLLYSYINSRTNNLLTNIYTTNVSQNDIDDILGERLASRIVRYSVCIELNGADLRGVKI